MALKSKVFAMFIVLKENLLSTSTMLSKIKMSLSQDLNNIIKSIMREVNYSKSNSPRLRLEFLLMNALIN